MTADILSGILLPLCIISGGLYFNIYLKGFYILHPVRTLRACVNGKKEAFSAFRSLCVSLAGALGIGNIAGVAVAVSVGGAGAVFWMWTGAVLSAVLKYCEIVLGIKFRRKSPSGEYSGGAVLYMRDGIGGITGKLISVCFACACVLSSFLLGNIVQLNSAADAFSSAFGLSPAVFGAFAAVICAVLVFGGYKRVSSCMVVVVPTMSVLYLVISVKLIIARSAALPAAFSEIFSGAFDISAAAGGIAGAVLNGALRHGTAKGAFSHEAGCGTAPFAYMNSDTRDPRLSGLLGIAEVLFDTVVICTVTALVLLVSGSPGGSPMESVIAAFSSYYGGYIKYIIALMAALFALSSAVSWAYYGRCGLSYLTKSKGALYIYLILYCAVAFAGTLLGKNAVWDFADVSVAVMTALNLYTLIRLRRRIKNETFPL